MIKRILPIVVLLVPLTACQPGQEGTGGALGGLGGAGAGALLGSALSRGSPAATLLGAAVGAGAGYFIGSSIGRSLDERDKQRAWSATAQALAQPVYAVEPLPQPSYGGGYAPAPRRPARQLTTRPVRWQSDHGTGAGGMATVTQVAAQPQGGECRTIREVAYVSGQEVVQNSRYCRPSPNAEWMAA